MKKLILAIFAAATVSACASVDGGNGPGEWSLFSGKDKFDDGSYVFAMNTDERGTYALSRLSAISFGCSADQGFYMSIMSDNFLDNSRTVPYQVRVDGYSAVKGRGKGYADGDSVGIEGRTAVALAKQVASAPKGAKIHVQIEGYFEYFTESFNAYDNNGSVTAAMQSCNVS